MIVKQRPPPNEPASNIFIKFIWLRLFALLGTLGLPLWQPLLADHSTQNSEHDIGKLIEKEVEFGNVLWLNDGQHDFLVIFTPAKNGTPQGGAIILHDAGSHPDHSEIIQPIRKTLSLHRWATIAIQLPTITDISQWSEHQEIINRRIRKALEYLSAHDVDNVVLIGHGAGAINSAAFLAETENTIHAYVAVSLGVLPSVDKTKVDKPKAVPALLERISLPMLDIFGSRDLPFVVRSADTRALAAKSPDGHESANGNEPDQPSANAAGTGNKSKNNMSYRQIKVEGADHHFRGKGQLLAKRILGWMDRHARAKADPADIGSNNIQ